MIADVSFGLEKGIIGSSGHLAYYFMDTLVRRPLLWNFTPKEKKFWFWHTGHCSLTRQLPSPLVQMLTHCLCGTDIIVFRTPLYALNRISGTPHVSLSDSPHEIGLLDF